VELYKNNQSLIGCAGSTSLSALAVAAHASGEVQVQVLIDTDGTVIAATVVSGHPLLQATAATAARGARFSPTKYKGELVKITGVIRYYFVAK